MIVLLTARSVRLLRARISRWSREDGSALEQGIPWVGRGFSGCRIAGSDDRILIQRSRKDSWNFAGTTPRFSSGDAGMRRRRKARDGNAVKTPFDRRPTFYLFYAFIYLLIRYTPVGTLYIAPRCDVHCTKVFVNVAFDLMEIRETIQTTHNEKSTLASVMSEVDRHVIAITRQPEITRIT